MMAPIAWLDARVQTGVDRFTWFVMRLVGVPKSLVRYAVYAAVACSGAVYWWGYDRRAINLIFALVWVYNAYLAKNHDEKIEATGTLPRVGYFSHACKVVWLFCGVVSLACAVPWPMPTWAWLLLLGEYMFATPPSPPPERKTVSELARATQ